ncbi:T9SS type A sorting domain-containing protein [Winogradskyella vidalii]|uniref:T9SS type A sorting domain-containing protein n=1 Tax=Winogradskyella vidalii TaxID=2615024 RepID=UPI0015C6FB77|nr:T9SS type A sorting domain-containing protein [Winogradskyella vidalii]
MSLNLTKKYAFVFIICCLVFNFSYTYAQVDSSQFKKFVGFKYSNTFKLISEYQDLRHKKISNQNTTPIYTNTVRNKSLGIKPELITHKRTTNQYDYHSFSYSGINIPSASITDSDGNTYITGGSSNDNSPEGNVVTIKVNNLGEEVWESRKLGTRYAVESGIAITDDVNGNPISTGMHWNGDNMDVVIIKYAAETGDVIWQSIYDGEGEGIDIPTAITSDNDGNTYIAGITYDNNTMTYLTLKYNSSGTLLWAVKDNNLVSESWNEPQAIVVDSDANIIVTGYAVNSEYWLGYYTIKYNSEGEKQWSHVHNYISELNENKNSIANDIALDNNQNIYITGTFDTSTLNSQIGTIKYAPDGTQEWVKDYKYETDGTEGHQIEVVENSTIYVGGTHNGSYTDDGIVLLSYNLEGIQNWAQKTDDLLNNSGSFLLIDTNNLPVISSKGYDEFSNTAIKSYRYEANGTLVDETNYSLSFSSNESIKNYVGFGLDNSDNQFLICDSYLTSEGNVFQYTKLPLATEATPEWTENYTNNGAGSSSMLYATTAENNVYITSTFGSIVDDVYISNKSLTKYNETGEVEWSKTYNTIDDTLGSFFGIASKIDSSGNIIVYLIADTYSLEPEPSRIIKYDTAGNLIWQTDFYFNTPQMYTLFLDHNDDIYISGSAKENAADYTSKFITTKISSTGNELWTQYTGSNNSEDNVFSISAGKVNSQGNIVLVGSVGSSSMMSQNTHLALLSYSSDGELIDLNTLQIDQNNSSGINLLIDDNDTIYVNGVQQNQITYKEESLLVKFDSNLQHQWTANHSEIDRQVRSYKLHQNSLGNIVMSCYSNSPQDNKVILVNYNTEGNELWTYNTEVNNYYVDFYIDNDDKIYLYNQFATNHLPYRLFHGFGSLTSGILNVIDENGIEIEAQSKIGPELSVFFPSVLIPLQNGTLLAGGTLSHELSYFEGLYFFETTHQPLSISQPNTAQSNNNWLGQNYPNPASTTTTIPFFLREGGQVSVKFFDLTGKKVLELSDDTNLPTGHNQININITNLTPGVYFYQLESGDYLQSKKIIIE